MIKSKSLFLFVVLTLGFSLANADSSLSAILSLKPGAQLNSSQVKQILNFHEVKKSRDLFYSGEKKILRQIHADYLSRSWILELKNEKSFDKIEKRIRLLGLPLNLDWNDLKASRQSEPFESLQWGLHNLGVPQNIDLDPMVNFRIPARQGEDVRLPNSPLKNPDKKILVAVLDTGIDKDHPDLKNIIHRNEKECQSLDKFLACAKDKSRNECEKEWMSSGNSEVDADQNGYPMDCQGWSLLGGVNAANIMGRPDFGDDQGHGTHVAGIIAAQNENGVGIRGLSSHVEILPVQVLGQQPSEPLKPLSIDVTPDEKGKEQYNKSLGDLVARGVIYAIRSGAKVINFSMGWPQSRDSQFMRQMIAEAQKQGIIIIAAAGNDSTKALLRPCAYPGVICVGAHGPDGALAHFSNYGSGVDIAAPGINILSTYPQEKRPVRFRSTLGYEFLSGTSQASPFVTAAVAELLAQGIPANEIYPRLILSSRPVQSHLPLYDNVPHLPNETVATGSEPYSKYMAGGNLDLQAALLQLPQPLLVPLQKEKQEIKWDRQDSNLFFEFSVKNYWQPVSTAQVKIQVDFERKDSEAIRPQIISILPLQNYADVWQPGEERRYQVKAQITDATDPSQSRIPSELGLTLSLSIGSQAPRQYVLDYEVLVSVSPDLKGSDILQIPVVGLPQQVRTSFLPIDENLDRETQKRDYLAVSQQKNTWQFWLLTQKDNFNSPYQVQGSAKVKVEGDENKIREQILTRIDLYNKGQSNYVVGLFEDKSDNEDDTASPMSFYYFSSDLKLIESYKYDSKQAQIPYQVYWHMIGGRQEPAWVGSGKNPEKKRNLRDRWENPQNFEKNDVRFYYLDRQHQLHSLRDYNGYRIVDIIQPRQDQVIAGRVSILLAKNTGTEAKPSYIYQFAVAEVFEGRIENFQEIDFFAQPESYRNVLDTRVDKVYSLDPRGEESNGSYWFGEGRNREQRMSLLNNQSFDMIDRSFQAQRAQYDSALWIRAAFLGEHRQGAFVLTNSEIQYHDLLTGGVTSSSFERYTFYPDMLMTNLYFPIVLRDTKNNQAKLPALFTTESSELNRGVKMLVPVFANNGRVIELVSPARLRLKAEQGCRPMDTPIFSGSEGYSFDYYCRDRIVRVRLAY